MEDHEGGKGQGIAFAAIFIVLGLAVPMYILFWLAHDSPWPHVWAKRDGYWFFLVFGGLFQISIINYLQASKRVDLEKIAKRFFHLEEYENKKTAEAILAHYTNMASVGFLLAIFVFTLKPFVLTVSIYVVAPVLTVLTLAIFAVYGVLLIKPLHRLTKHPFYIGIPLLVIILMTDMQGFKLFLLGIPSQ